MHADSAVAKVAPLLVDLLQRASIEIAPGHPRTVDILHDQFDPGTAVYINLAPNGDYCAVAEAATSLQRAGFRPIPHIAARNLPSRAALDDFVARLSGDAGVDRVLVIAGDRDPPAGPFSSTLEVMRTGVLAQRGIRAIGVAGHPEGHPMIAVEALGEALREKVTAAAEEGLAPFIVTQFCFEARPVLDWLTRIRAAGIGVPVELGVAGPATLATLVKFGLRCGIGNSFRALRNRTNLVGGLLGEAGPEGLLRDLAAGLAATPKFGVVGVHFFPFGGVARTGDFITVTLSRLYSNIPPAADAATSAV